MKKIVKPQEIIDIEAAADRHENLFWWEKQFRIAGWIWIAVFAGVFLFTDFSTALPFAFMAYVALIIEFIFTRKRRKQFRAFMKLVGAFQRKNAMPLYKDMLEKFADDPNTHIHLDDAGMIHFKIDKKKDGDES